MIQKLIKKYNEFKSARLYPDADKHAALLESTSLDLANAFRFANQFQNRLPAPINSALDVAFNLQVVADHIWSSDMKVTPTLDRRLTQRVKEMEMCIKNFDHIIAKKLRKKISQENDKVWFRRMTLQKLLEKTIAEINYAEEPYKEWMLDSYERIQHLYFIIRVIANRNSNEHPVIEDLIYLALFDYKLTRGKQLMEAALI